MCSFVLMFSLHMTQLFAHTRLNPLRCVLGGREMFTKDTKSDAATDGRRKRVRLDDFEMNALAQQMRWHHIGMLPQSQPGTLVTESDSASSSSSSSSASSATASASVKYNPDVTRFTANTHWSLCEMSCKQNAFYIGSFECKQAPTQSVFHLLFHEQDQSGYRMRLFMSSVEVKERYSTLNRSYTMPELNGLALVQSSVAYVFETYMGVLVESCQLRHQTTHSALTTSAATAAAASTATSSSSSSSADVSTAAVYAGYGAVPHVLACDLSLRGVPGKAYIPGIPCVGPPPSQPFNFTTDAACVSWNAASRGARLLPAVAHIRNLLEQNKVELTLAGIYFAVN